MFAIEATLKDSYLGPKKISGYKQEEQKQTNHEESFL